jgi:hypothetical protein
VVEQSVVQGAEGEAVVRFVGAVEGEPADMSCLDADGAGSER